MDLLESLVDELGKQNSVLNLSFINELNCNIRNQLSKMYSQYKIDLDKYFLVQELVSYGYKLESLIKTKSTKILDLQMSFFSNLLNPIILEIKEICYNLTNELVEDIKNKIEEYSNLMDEILNQSNTLLISYSKCLKFVQINNFITVPVFGKQYLSAKLNDTSFNEFGITLKIMNSNYKNQLKPVIGLLGIFNIPDKNDLFFKKFDWVWKINHLDTLSTRSVTKYPIDKNLNLFKSKFMELSLQENYNKENSENLLNLIGKIVSNSLDNFVDNSIDNSHNPNYLDTHEDTHIHTQDENLSIIEPIELEHIEQMKNFQIVQSVAQPENQNKKDICIELIDNSIVEEQIEQSKLHGKKKNKKNNLAKDNSNIIKEFMDEKNSSGLTVVEDLSFVLPIDNPSDEQYGCV